MRWDSAGAVTDEERTVRNAAANWIISPDPVLAITLDAKETLPVAPIAVRSLN